MSLWQIMIFQHPGLKSSWNTWKLWTFSEVEGQNRTKTNLYVSDCGICDICWASRVISLIRFLGVQYQTKESCLSTLGSSVQNPKLVDPLKHIGIVSCKGSQNFNTSINKILKFYRKCCWSWATLVVIIVWISQIRRHYDPATLQNGSWNLHTIFFFPPFFSQAHCKYTFANTTSLILCSRSRESCINNIQELKISSKRIYD